MSGNYQFEIEGKRLDVPKNFNRFSVMVSKFMESYGDCEVQIPLPDYKKECLLKIIEFFHILEESPRRVDEKNPPGDFGVKNNDFLTLSEESGCEGLKNQAKLESQAIVEKEKPGAAKAATDETTNAYKHLNHDIKVISLPSWATQFFDSMEKKALFETCILANFMLAHPFIEHAALYIANKLKSLNTIAEMRDYLNTQADFAENEFDVLANDPAWRQRLEAEGLWRPKDVADSGQSADVFKTV